MIVAIVVNEENKKAVETSMLLVAYFLSQGIDYRLMNTADIPAEPTDIAFGLAVVLGGDGSILRCASYLSNQDTPLLGINFGHLGFLANSSEAGVLEIVAAALAGDVTEEERTNVHADVFYTNSESNDDDELECMSVFALNEVAIARGASGRIVDFGLRVSGDKVADMRGDGLVVATATGSTAYALSCGGPLVSSGFRGLVAVPIAPHTLVSRAMVVEPNDIIEVELAEGVNREEAMIFADGTTVSVPGAISHVQLRRGSRPTRLLRYRKESFYTQVSRVFFGNQPFEASSQH